MTLTDLFFLLLFHFYLYICHYDLPFIFINVFCTFAFIVIVPSCLLFILNFAIVFYMYYCDIIYCFFLTVISFYYYYNLLLFLIFLFILLFL